MGKKTAKVGDTKPKKQAEKENTGASSVRTPILLGKGGEVRVTILAKPGARLSAITGLSKEGVGVAVAAPPMDGEANAELIRFMAQVLGLRRSDLSLDSGARSRNKVLSISGLTVADVELKLKNAIE